MNEQDKTTIKETLITLINLTFNAEAKRPESDADEVKKYKQELLDRINQLFEVK